MPYIKVGQRNLAWIRPEGAGPLCYALCKQLQDYRARLGDSFATFADILAALSAAEAEFKRCVLAPYEERRRQENGEVWG